MNVFIIIALLWKDIPMADERFFPLTEFGSPIQQTVMPLVTLVDGQIISVGTGFMIQADGLMLTARHVIDYALTHRTRFLNDSGEWKDSFELYAFYLTNQPHEDNKEKFNGGLWPIDFVWPTEMLDIGYCWLRKATVNEKPLTFRPVVLSFRIPKAGDQIGGFGYYAGKGSYKIIEGEQPKGEYSHETAITKGIIKDVFPVKREEGLLKFPCFQTDAQFNPGMSGGPVFNEKGHVCGLICSSMPPTEDDPNYVSHASLLWPILGTFVEVCLDQSGKTRLVSINEIIQRNLISTDGSERNIEVSTSPDGNTTVSIRADD